MEIDELETMANAPDSEITNQGNDGAHASSTIDTDPVVVHSRESGDEQHPALLTMKQKALLGLPAEWREKLIADAGLAGVKHDNDVGWLLVGSVIDSAAAAFAAGDAAKLVHEDVQKLPKTMQDALLLASKDFNGQVREILGKSGGEFIGILKNMIVDSANAGAEKLKQATSTLDGELTRKIEIRKDEGVELWTQKAMEAANLALAKHKAVNFYFNTIGGSTIFIAGVIIGALITTHLL